MALSGGKEQTEEPRVESFQLQLEYARLSVSQLSNVFWSIQAALRIAALENPETQDLFLSAKPPLLTIQEIETGNSVLIEFLFIDSYTASVAGTVSVLVFRHFVRQFIHWLRFRPQTPQRPGPKRERNRRRREIYPGELFDRIKQIDANLKGFGRKTIRYNGYKVTIEGEHIEIEEPRT